MKIKTKYLSLAVILNCILVLDFFNPVFGQTPQDWRLMVPAQLQQEEAVKIALDDLKTFAKDLGIIFNVTDDQESIKSPAIIVGDSSLNKATAGLLNHSEISLQGVNDEQGYEIITSKTKDGKIIVISGSSVIGNVPDG